MLYNINNERKNIEEIRILAFLKRDDAKDYFVNFNLSATLPQSLYLSDLHISFGVADVWQIVADHDLPRGFRIMSEMVSWWLWQMVDKLQK